MLRNHSIAVAIACLPEKKLWKVDLLSDDLDQIPKASAAGPTILAT